MAKNSSVVGVTLIGLIHFLPTVFSYTLKDNPESFFAKPSFLLEESNV